MAPPPSKRQKRRTVVSPDEEEDTDTTDEHRDHSTVAKESQSKAHVRLASHNRSTNRSLPTRSRTKICTTPKSRSATPGTPASASSSSEDHPHKPKRVQEAQKRGSLHAYFNAANGVHQHKKEVRPNVENLSLEVEEEDLIEDDSLDEELQRLSSVHDGPLSTIGPRGGLVVSTTNRAVPVDLGKPPSGSQKFLRASRASGKDTSSQAVVTDRRVDLRPWADKYAPKGLEELMVHKKKVADVRLWLERAFLGQERKVYLLNLLLGHRYAKSVKRLLILKGPSGAGKTATISALATAMDFEVTEWRNPINSDYTSEGYHSMSVQFDDFLGRSGKFGSLTLAGGGSSTDSLTRASSSLLPESTKEKVILLEEFPSTFMSASIALRSFRSNILQQLAANPTSNIVNPIILIITETRQNSIVAADDSFTAHRLLGSDILTHPSTTSIEFNPIAPTLLTKALDLIIQKEARNSGRRRIPGPSVLKKLGEVGDVRSAIGSLEFLCLRANDGDDWGGRVASRGRKGVSTLTKMERESLEMVTQRESSLGIFHAVGKVVYNKREEPTAVDYLPQTPEHLRRYDRPMVSQVSVDELLNEKGTDVSTLIAALHENYILSCESPSFTDSFNGCIDALSDSDLLSLDRGVGSNSFGRGLDTSRQDEIAFHVAVRGMLFALPYPVKRRATDGGARGRGDAFKMLWPSSMRLRRRREETESLVDTWHERRQAESGLPASLTREQGVAVDGPFNDATLQPIPHTEPFRTSLSSTHDELILERLPYTAKISPGNSELERITKFDGIDKATDEEDAEISDSISKPQVTQGRDRTRNAEAMSTRLAPGAGGKLWLSDDDIEDD